MIGREGRGEGRTVWRFLFYSIDGNRSVERLFIGKVLGFLGVEKGWGGRKDIVLDCKEG